MDYIKDYIEAVPKSTSREQLPQVIQNGIRMLNLEVLTVILLKDTYFWNQ
jgi:hypothetical protein